MTQQPVRFTILGSGTSAGVPVIGCECDVCTSPDPRDKRFRPSACIETVDADGQHRVILIDTSPDLRMQSLRHGLNRCDDILFTHHHVDHVFGLDDVRRFNVLMDSPITVHGEPITLQHVRRMFQHIFEPASNTNKSFVATLIPHAINVGARFDLHGLSFMPIRFMHGRLPIIGFRIDRVTGGPGNGSDDPLPLAYCTDVSSIPPESWGMLVGLKTLILDALRYRHHPTHMTIDQAVDAARQIGAERTYFTHMTHDVLHASLEADLPDGVAPSHDGLTLGSLDGRQ
ncbi:MAG: MBL fold metallo-hydrolase [Planctomycetes bacterium]|nr:MBL fold metallo-hydrolase [Planctomycetota bacterium]NOG55911.1 MBL fold metallo-hydrolase [Planctomycetota bacterium]